MESGHLPDVTSCRTLSHPSSGPLLCFPRCSPAVEDVCSRNKHTLLSENKCEIFSKGFVSSYWIYALGSTAEFIFLSLSSAGLVSTTFNMKSYQVNIFLKKYTILFVHLFSRVVKVLKALNLLWAFDKIYASHSPTQINKMIFLNNFKQTHTFFSEFRSVFSGRQ